MNLEMLQNTIDQLVVQGRGILAADESAPTIKKRFDSIGIEATEASRRTYREMLFQTPDLEKFISGIILFEETLEQVTHDQTPFPELLIKKGIVPGIKVDKGLIPLLGNTEGHTVTQGLDGLGQRLEHYKAYGARFTKWRAALRIAPNSRLAIQENAQILARYAAIAQQHDYIPIVEPEVLIEGSHTMKQCSAFTETLLREVFGALAQHNVLLEYIILKPSMVISGNTCSVQETVDAVSEETLKILKRTVPAAIPSINFLSGGQTPEQATAHLNRMNQMLNTTNVRPWSLSFSYARALQAPALTAWGGNDKSIKIAQSVLAKRAQLNSLATQGDYEITME